MGTRGPIFPGKWGPQWENGDPIFPGKWGPQWENGDPLPSDFRKATSRPVSSVPVYEVYKMEQSSSYLSVRLQNGKRQSSRTRTVYIQRYTSLSSRRPLPRRVHKVRKASSSKESQVFLRKGCRSFLCRWSIKYLNCHLLS